MAEGSKGGTPKLAHTDFESMTHEQLLALVESASSEGASQLAGKLGKAASTITKIGDDLMTYTKGLHWQGEGGDAFRAWGTQSASATLYLGEYSEVASRWMAVVAQAIAEAKASMPPASDTAQAKADLRTANKNMAAAQKAHNDPDAAKVTRDSKADAAAAQGRIEAARAEAVQRMRKLAQTYQQSAQQVNGVTPPTFAPPASHAEDPGWWYKSDEHQAVPGQPTPGQAGGPAPSGPTGAVPGPSGAVPPSSHGAPSNTPDRAPVSHPPSAVPSPHTVPDPVGMGIDRVATPPAPPSVPEGPPPPAPSPRPDLATPPHLGAPPPPFGPSLGQPGPNAVPPGRTAPAVRPSLPLPTGPSANGLGNRLPRDPGILGGRPVPPNTGRPTTGIPRSNVFGGEHMQGRPPMSQGIGTGNGGPGPGRTGVVGGRRLTGEPGGMIGRQPQQPGRVDGRPFTPGGAGLVRGSAAGDSQRSAVGRPAAVPQPGRGSAARRDEDRPQRSDHLSEEEETWQPDQRRIVPPVVD